MITQQRIPEIIADIQKNYTADAWQRSYPNGMSGVALLDAIESLTEEQIEHGIARVPQEHAAWPLGIAQFGNLCKEKKVRHGSHGCSIRGCWVPTGLTRCEYHPNHLRAYDLDLITQALSKHREFVEYQIFIQSVSLVSLVGPGQLIEGSKVWPEWTDQMLAMYEANPPGNNESPMQYRQRISCEAKQLIENQLYPAHRYA